MKIWAHEKFTEFQGKDVVIIGGGRSLKEFDFLRLEGFASIGINDAYKLGPDIVRVCFFSDLAWWYKNQDGLKNFHEAGGIVVTHNPTVTHETPPEWLCCMTRLKDGLSREAIGYGNGSGPSSINLALLLGAKNVLLLGFDGKESPDNRNHWYDEVQSHPNPDVYRKFNDGFRKVAEQLELVYPGTEVLILSEDTSLDMFPIFEPDEILNNEQDD